jgi:hypothetical protein
MATWLALNSAAGARTTREFTRQHFPMTREFDQTNLFHLGIDW